MKILTPLIAALVLTACVPAPFKYWDEADRAPKVGDLVRVETLGGKREVMRVYRLDKDGFAGVTSDERRYRVSYKIVKVLEVRTTEWELVNLPVRPYF
jgi:hypothetical protein